MWKEQARAALRFARADAIEDAHPVRLAPLIRACLAVMGFCLLVDVLLGYFLSQAQVEDLANAQSVALARTAVTGAVWLTSAVFAVLVGLLGRASSPRWPLLAAVGCVLLRLLVLPATFAALRLLPIDRFVAVSIALSAFGAALSFALGVFAVIHARNTVPRVATLPLSIAGLGLYALVTAAGFGLYTLQLPALVLFVATFISTLAFFAALLALPWVPTGVRDDAVGAQVASPSANRGTDLLVGGAFVVGGLGITAYTATTGGIDGRVVLAWGPILYGLFRIGRAALR